MNFIFNNKYKLTFFTGILLFVFLSTIYIYNINIYGSFHISLFDGDKNISEGIEVKGISFTNREQKLDFKDGAWYNGSWYFKKIKIKIDSSFTGNKILNIKIINNANNIILDAYEIKSNVSDLEVSSISKNNNFFKKAIFFFSYYRPLILKCLNAILLLLLVLYFLKKTKTDNNVSELNIYPLKIIIAFCFSILLAIIVYLSFFIFPNAEELGITRDMITQKNPISFFYNNSDGRYFTNILYFILNPLAYGLPYSFYKFIPITIFSFLYLSVYYLIATVNFYKRKTYNMMTAAVIVFIYFSFIPNFPSSLFFMGTTYHYTVLPVILCILLAEIYKHINEIRNYSTCKIAFLIIVFQGLNAFALMITPILLAFLWYYDFRKKQTISKSTILFSVIWIITSLIVISSPGNYIRLFNNACINYISIPFYKRIFIALLYSITANITLILKTIKDYPVIFPLYILALLWLPKFFRVYITHTFRIKKNIILFLLITFYCLCIVPLPFYYSGIWAYNNNDYSGVWFFHNSIYFLFVIVNILFIPYISTTYSGLSEKLEYLFKKHLGFQITFWILFFSSFLLSKNIYNDTFKDIKSGVLGKYYEEMMSRHFNIYKKNSSCSIVINELKNKPLTVFCGVDHFNDHHIISLNTFSGLKNIYTVNIYGDTVLKECNIKHKYDFLKPFKNEDVKAKIHEFGVSNFIEKIKNICKQKTFFLFKSQYKSKDICTLYYFNFCHCDFKNSLFVTFIAATNFNKTSNCRIDFQLKSESDKAFEYNGVFSFRKIKESPIIIIEKNIPIDTSSSNYNKLMFLMQKEVLKADISNIVFSEKEPDALKETN